MSDEVCMHELGARTCSICSKSNMGSASQDRIVRAAVRIAVQELGAGGATFRTKDVSTTQSS